MAQCISPFKVETGFFAPCGKCVFCRKRRAAGWSFRLQQELINADTAWFVTYTYDNENIEFSQNNMPTLVKKHFQLYMKKLRHDAKKTGIKYYAVGEYGTKSWRPHYHAILINVELEHVIGLANAVFALNNKELALNGTYEFTNENWDKGHMTVGRVNKKTIKYVLKYITKATRVPVHANDYRQKEFSLMSKGLGKRYIDYNKKWHKKDIFNRVYLQDGEHKISMPRYYKDKIYTKLQRQSIGLVSEERQIEKYQEDLSTLTKKQFDDKMTKEAAIIVENYHKGNRKKITDNDKF
ncbi:MAG: replication initiator protein [Microviridae sp.]|nr:MAG: replication initiator protein [Microviridae sp.]